MLLVVLAVEALNAIVFVLMPARLLTVYSAHWLIEQSEAAVLAIFQADVESKGSAFRAAWSGQSFANPLAARMG